MESQLEQLSILRAIAQLKKYKYNIDVAKIQHRKSALNGFYFLI